MTPAYPTASRGTSLNSLGAPFVKARTHFDYWLYARLFSASCLMAVDDGNLVGAVIAFRSQDEPDDVYVQDVMVHPSRRRGGVATTLVDTVAARAAEWGCGRLYLTSEPENTGAHITETPLMVLSPMMFVKPIAVHDVSARAKHGSQRPVRLAGPEGRRQRASLRRREAMPCRERGCVDRAAAVGGQGQQRPD
jgi:GNAT superfamily N-acetyltransferase